MKIIEDLRLRLHMALEKGNPDEILAISQELDIEIVKYMRGQLKKAANSSINILKGDKYGGYICQRRLI